jgi:predicted PurR-regulated permease PerM
VAIFAVLSGTALWGVLGALLGIPAAAAIKVAFEHFRPA